MGLGSEKEEDFEHEDIKAKPKRRVREDKKFKKFKSDQRTSQSNSLPAVLRTLSLKAGKDTAGERSIKKVQVKGKDGYLVTKLEPAWESFSEEEPAPKGKKKSAGPGTGQGSINSYFFKK
ncbi:hypothetical protein C7212DRAFT_348295 [Tuber magnatum]|uniref:Uncharacterized protein n=1 Tax=Tuber magnatum TaxID=42249 RepID=A0A317SCY9_9PEZI|nr:hypothetical protein C7212DRAFT_348293 [Tuber magnatum]PWW72372.1 hypothetical protein C7212DRAFT_348295 [Tuber magnatum]